MRKKPTRPEDLLPDNKDTTEFQGVPIRKGTMGATLRNVDVIESADTTEADKQQALEIIKETAPALKAMGLTRHMEWKNPVIQDIFNKID